MALSMRHWAVSCGVIEENNGAMQPTELGRRLFGGDRPWDPYMERPATSWLAQWRVAGTPDQTTTWYWAFNHVASSTFDHESLTQAILAYCRERRWPRIAEKTVSRDVECFIRSYVPRIDKNFAEDALEPVLAELGLVRPIGGRMYEFRRGAKPTLPDAVFAFALNEFWDRYAGDVASLAVEAIAYEPGSPGRVFKLDENSLVERLANIGAVTKDRLVWSDTAGVRQVIRAKRIADPLALLAGAYSEPERSRVA